MTTTGELSYVSTGGQDVPVITMKGTPHQCGVQYGTVVRELISYTVDAYLESFYRHHGLRSEQIFEIAREFEPMIESYDPATLEEMRGIAHGAGIPFEAVLTLNARSELVHGLKARLDEGCTSFAAVAPATADGSTIIGQNWDWSPAIRKSTVILDIERQGDPRILTMAEAGLVGKIGLNEAGVGLCVNFLLSDTRRFGTPVHLIRRKVLSAPTFDSAVRSVVEADRALAANYLIGHADGEVVDIEAWPGDVSLVTATDGVISHSNHFLTASDDRDDLGKLIYPDTLLRDGRLRERLTEHAGGIDVGTCQDALRDHSNLPDSICRHLNPSERQENQIETLGSVVIDLTNRSFGFCSGPPCQGSFISLSF
ncbi:MAG: C45 family autoproteolytic acyltransferase/hydrolase, partial [Candidatus Limnocylindria bacterium]